MPSSFTVDTSSSRRSGLLLAVLLVVCVLLLVGYGREGADGPLHGVQSAVSTALLPAKALSGGVSAAEDSAAEGLSNATADDSTLSGLREQNEQLRAEVSQLEQYRQEAQSLQGLLGVKDSYQVDGVACHVLSRGSEAWDQQVTLDKGTDDGVRVGLAVVSSDGLVGQVSGVGPSSCQVRLVTDSKSGVSAMVQSSHAQGILRGSLDGVLYFEGVDDSATVNEGDVIVTSGVGGAFSTGIMVGTVTRVEDSQGASSRRIVVTPNASAGVSDAVLVVTSSGAGDSGSDADDGSEG